MSLNQSTVYKTILAIVGLFIIYVGINVGFGGIQTMGWQVSPDFITVANEADFAVQDNHVRFLGGLFGAMGIVMLLAVTNLKRYQSELRLIFVVMFIGGIARWTSLQPDVILSANIITSFLAETILMPVLFFWLPRIVEDTA